MRIHKELAVHWLAKAADRGHVKAIELLEKIKANE